MANWKETTAYVFKNGVWQKALVYNCLNNKWSPAEFKVYSATSHEEEPNEYGTTAIISNYTTEQNNYGTTVVIG